MVYPDPYNYDLSSLTRAREEEGAVVESVSRALGSLVEWLYTKTEMITAGCSLPRCICKLCDFRVTSKLLLNSHTESYHEVCHECDKNYLQKFELTVHIQLIHLCQMYTL